MFQTGKCNFAVRLALLLLFPQLAACHMAGQSETPGPAEPVPASYFGLHIHRFPLPADVEPHAYTAGQILADAPPPVWPSVPLASWRLWDVGVSWMEIEPEPNQWHFERLDAAVAQAELHHVSLLLTLGLTPQWASSRPNEKSGYKPGNAAPPAAMADWENYVQTVASRYRGRIQAYEIWNEPNLDLNFTGSPAVMAEMTRRAARLLRLADPVARIVSASVTGRGGLKWLDEYLGWGVGNVVDVIGYHLYVTPDPPEKMLSLALDLRHTLDAHGLKSKPIWNTESGWAKPRQFASDDEAAAFLARALLLNWAGGVRRFYWYAWDNYWWVSLRTIDPHTRQPLAPARAYTRIAQWMTGAILHSCSADANALWQCQLQRDGHPYWIVWRADGSANLRLPDAMKTARRATTLDGRAAPIYAGTVSVGLSPLLIEP